MKVTLLVSVDAMGVPAPLWDCEYCRRSNKRRFISGKFDYTNADIAFIEGGIFGAEVHEIDSLFKEDMECSKASK